MAETTVKLSEEKVLVIAPLTARQLRDSSTRLPADLDPRNKVAAALVISETQALCSVRKLNDRFVDPSKSDIDFDLVMDSLTGEELMKLVEAYNASSDIPTGEELKNSSTDPK